MRTSPTENRAETSASGRFRRRKAPRSTPQAASDGGSASSWRKSELWGAEKRGEVTALALESFGFNVAARVSVASLKFWRNPSIFQRIKLRY